MKYFEEELQEYVCNLCESKNMPPVDFRFRCFGDINKFWSSKTNSYFELDCVNYYATDTEDVKILVSHIIDLLWEHATQPNHRVALYIEDITDRDNWVDVIIGGCLYEDDSLL